MKSITELTRERLVYHGRFNSQKSEPIVRIHRFSVYKLRILKRLYTSTYGELNFLIQDDQKPAEKCIVYAILYKPNIVHEIKYWRVVALDKELAGYIVKAFIRGYLAEVYAVNRVALHNT